MKGREIIKRNVVSLSEAADVGKIDNVVFNHQARLAAVVIKDGRQKAGLMATGAGNLHAIGRDVVTINESEAIEGAEKVEELSAYPSLRQLVGCRVITEGGIYLGCIQDVVIDADEWRITDFILKGRGVLGLLGGDTIPAAGHLRFGKEIVVVPNAVTVKGRAELESMAEPSPVGALPEPLGVAKAAGASGRVVDGKGSLREGTEEGGLTRTIGA